MNRATKERTGPRNIIDKKRTPGLAVMGTGLQVGDRTGEERKKGRNIEKKINRENSIPDTRIRGRFVLVG